MAFAEDLAPFFTDFAVPCAVNGVQVRAIFERPYADPFGGQVDATSPTLLAPSADLAGVERDSLITVDGQAYRVTTAQPDGTGLTLLTLGSA